MCTYKCVGYTLFRVFQTLHVRGRCSTRKCTGNHTYYYSSPYMHELLQPSHPTYIINKLFAPFNHGLVYSICMSFFLWLVLLALYHPDLLLTPYKNINKSPLKLAIKKHHLSTSSLQ